MKYIEIQQKGHCMTLMEPLTFLLETYHPNHSYSSYGRFHQ